MCDNNVSEFSTMSPKTAHNNAISEFLNTGSRDHATLLNHLNEIINISKPASPTLLYNCAVIYFHRHMYHAALDTLMPVANKLNIMEDSTGNSIGILMLRLFIATNQLHKAHAYLEMLSSSNKKNIFGQLLTDRASPAELAKKSNQEQEQYRSLRLLAMLIFVLCRKQIVIPEDSVEFATLKAHQYYIMKDFQMASKQLKKINGEIGDDYVQGTELRTCIANNMGVIHLRVRHYAIAAKFFQDAIQFDRYIAGNLRNCPLHLMSSAHSCEILYNLGISLLYLRRPKEAFQCFLVPLKTYHSNPRLWYRISEACIMDHEMRALEEEKRAFVATMNAMNAGGPNNMRRRQCVSKPTLRASYTTTNSSAAVPEANLEFAALALRNALSLTKYYTNHFQPAKEPESLDGDTDWENAHDHNFCDPSSKLVTKESFDELLSAIHAAYSYVSLRLGDFVRAHDMARDLLNAEKLSDAHKMLAHMYIGEALVMMERMGEARPYLEPQLVPLNAFDFETKDWQVKSLDAAQNIIRYNLAVSMVLIGDIDRAKNLLMTCKHPIVTAKAMALKMHIDLRY